MTLSQSLTCLQQQSISIVQATSVVNNFGTRVASSGAGIIKLADGMQQLAKAAEKGMEISDAYTNISTKLSMITSGALQLKSLQDEIFHAADRARGSYTDMAGIVGKLGTTAGQQFGGNQNIVRFAETTQKMFRIGGTPAAKQSGDMARIQQTVGSGRLQGQDFSALTQDAPMVETAIAKYMNKSVGDVQQLGTGGKITSQVLINSILNYSGTVDQQISKMSYTWSDYWNKIKNGAYQAFGGVFSSENSLLASNGAQSGVNGIVGSFSILAGVAGGVLTGIANVGGFIAQNWSIIAPIIGGVVAITLVWLAVTKGAMLVQAAWTAITGIWDTVVTGANIVLGLFTGVTDAAADAQSFFNSSILASPLTWILIIIIAIIAVIYIVVAVIDNVTGQALSATGIIIGSLLTAGTFILNIAIGVLNAIIEAVWSFIYPILSIVEWVLNVTNGGFNSFGDAVKNLLGQIISWFLQLGKVVTTIIDAIFGTKWTDGLTSLQKNVTSWGKSKKIITVADKNAPVIQRITYSGAWNTGYSAGQGIDKSVKGLFNSKTAPAPTKLSSLIPPGIIPSGILSLGKSPLGTAPLGMAQNPTTVKGTGTGGTVEVNIADQDLQYLRDLAEKSYINKFSTAVLSPKISVNIEGSGNTTSDKNLSKRISNILQNQISTAAEGNYV